MAISIRIKRGTEANILAADLAAGEMAFATDTKAVYVSDGTAEHLIGKSLVGTFAARPSYGVAGRTYYDNTNGILWVDTGSAWAQPQIVYSGSANVPSSDEKAALVGTNGTPNSSNKYVTNSDPRLGVVGTIEAHSQAATTITGGTFTAGNYIFPANSSGTTVTIHASTGDTATQGSDLVTNGAFTSDASGWTLGEGWEYDGTNKRAKHIPNRISTVSVANGGTGYTSGDVLTLAGGTGGTVTVSSVNSGVVAGVTLTTGGSGYSVSTQAVSGGTGADCTINILSLCTAALEQNVGAVAENMYRVVFTTTRSAGSVTPSVGGNTAAWSTAVSSATTSTQDIWSTNTSNLKFVPSADFDGSVDTVSCKLWTASNPGLTFKDAAGNIQWETRDGANNSVLIGSSAGRYYASAYSVAVGHQAMERCATGGRSVAVGYQALLRNQGLYNVGVGALCASNNTTGSSNTAVGYYALGANTSGMGNNAIGINALYSNTTGTYNVASGFNAMYSTTTGSNNVAVGRQALYTNVSGQYNTAYGGQSLYSATGSNNVALGYQAGYNNSTGSNNVLIGYLAGFSETGSNKLYIATSNTATPLIYGEFDNNLVKIRGDIRPATNDTYDLGSSALMWDDIYATNSTIQTSDANKKDSIADIAIGLEFINKLRPVSFKWKDYTYTEQVALPLEYDENGDPLPQEWEEVEVEKTFTRRHSGLIAQEVKAVMDELEISTTNFAAYIDTGDDGLALRYEEFIAPIIKAIQELSARVEALES